MIDYPPVFILASERSGTNLLRKLVSEHQRVYFGPSPAHFLKHLYFRTPRYGPLDEPVNFRALVEDALQLCYVHFSPWGLELTAEEVMRGYSEWYSEKNVILLTHYLMSLYAKNRGYKTYICKDNYLYEFVLDILYELPEAKFIYLHRDPRDYALSQFHRRMITDSFFLNARLWDYEQTKCIKYDELLGKSRVYRLSYEALITDNKKAIRGLLQYLQVEYCEQEDKVSSAGEVPQEWQNLEKPVMRDNLGKYKNEMNRHQIALVESICAGNMAYLGYDRDSKGSTGRIYRLFDFLKGQATYFIRTRILPGKKQDELVKRRIPLALRLFVRWRQP